MGGQAAQAATELRREEKHPGVAMHSRCPAHLMLEQLHLDLGWVRIWLVALVDGHDDGHAACLGLSSTSREISISLPVAHANH